MLIHDRRRCRPLPGLEVRRRLALAQRAKLSHLEHGGWQLLFVRAGTAYISHDEFGQGVLTPDARLIMARTVRLRQDDELADALDGGPGDVAMPPGPQQLATNVSHAA